MSKSPWCVGPSSPLSPPRSMQKTTGRFCRHTSWTIWSKAHRQPHRLRLHAIDIQMQLRRILQRVGTHAGQQFVLAGLAEQGVACLGECIATGAATILQIHVEAAELAQSLHGGDVGHEDAGIVNLLHGAVGALDELAGGDVTVGPDGRV